MRAELPWTITGIPLEAREAARAAARREGLSVGEWMTRRILRSLSGLEAGLPPEGEADNEFGLPAASAARLQNEEMLARGRRNETESAEIYRRIEEQLRYVARRLESTERGQSENNRVISRTASEITVSSREQAQAFEQLGTLITSLGERRVGKEC